MSRSSSDEAGFTLIELIMAIVITSVIVGAIAGAIILALRQTTSAEEMLSASRSAQLLSVYLSPDLRSGSAGASATTGGTSCSGLTNVLDLRWSEPAVTTTTYEAAYAVEQANAGTSSAEWELERFLCVNGGAATKIIVSHRLLNATAAVADVSQAPLVTMTVTPTSGASFTVSGRRRV